MGKLRPIQQSFSNGEVTPLMHFRSDDEGYRSSCKTMRNFITTAHGPAKRRNGTDLLWWDKDGEAGASGRLFQFSISKDESYVVLVTTKKIYIVGKAGMVDSTNVVDNPNFCSPQHWSSYSNSSYASVTVGGSSCGAYFEVTGTYPPAGVYERRYACLTQRITLTSPNKPQTLSIDYSSDRYESHGDPAGTLFVFLSDTPNPPNVYDNSTWFGWRIWQNDGVKYWQIGDQLEGRTSFYVHVLCEGYEHTFSANVRFLSISETDSSGTTEFPSPYTTDAMLKGLQVAQNPYDSFSSLYFVNKSVPIKTLIFHGGVFHFSDLILAHQPWGTDYPSVVAFHQGRMWLAASETRPSTIWASQSGTTSTFKIPSTVDDASAMEFDLDFIGEITWMLPLRELHVGTEFNEVIITAEGKIVTTDDASAEIQSSYGSCRIQPKYFSDGFIFIDSNYSRMYYTNYFDERRTFIAKDVLFKAEHMASHNITEAVVARTENMSIWFTDRLGHLHVNVTEPSIGIDGWSEQDTNGHFESVVAVSESGIEQIYLLVKRMINNRTVLMLEKMSRNVYMDAAIDLHSDNPTTIFDGLEHLEGQTVQVLADYVPSSMHVDPSDSDLTIFAYPENLYAGETIRFRAWIEIGGTNVPIKSYAWTFAGGSPATSTKSDVGVIFAATGDHIVNLTVVTADGKTLSNSKTITIKANDLQIQAFRAADGIPIPPDIITVGQAIKFIATSANGAVTNYQWTFNGGTPGAASVDAPVVEWAAAGHHTVSLTAQADGHTVTDNIEVTVRDPFGPAIATRAVVSPEKSIGHRLKEHKVRNGAITLESPSRNVLVGLGYKSVLETLPIEIETAREGPSNTKMKRFNKLYVKLMNSARPIINGQMPRQRTPATLMGNREPNETTDIQVLNLGYDRQATIKIEQELPFPCVVIGIYGEMASEGL